MIQMFIVEFILLYPRIFIKIINSDFPRVKRKNVNVKKKEIILKIKIFYLYYQKENLKIHF